MDSAPRIDNPNIVPCLVFPFDKVRVRQGRCDPAAREFLSRELCVQ